MKVFAVSGPIRLIRASDNAVVEVPSGTDVDALDDLGSSKEVRRSTPNLHSPVWYADALHYAPKAHIISPVQYAAHGFSE